MTATISLTRIAAVPPVRACNRIASGQTTSWSGSPVVRYHIDGHGVVRGRGASGVRSFEESSEDAKRLRQAHGARLNGGIK